MSEEETEFAGPDYEVVDPYENSDPTSDLVVEEQPEEQAHESNDQTTLEEDQRATLEAAGIDPDAFAGSVKDAKLAQNLIDAIFQNGRSKTEEKKEDQFDIDLNESFYDPEIVSQFRSMKNYYDAQIAELRGQLLSMNKISESGKVASMFDKLNQPERFGSGVIESNTKEGKNRQRVLDEVKALKAGYQATNRALPADEHMFAKAINLVFGEEMAETVRREFSDKVENRHNSRIARPNTRVSKPNNKIAEATRNVAALMRDRGMGGSNETFE